MALTRGLDETIVKDSKWTKWILLNFLMDFNEILKDSHQIIKDFIKILKVFSLTF